MTNTHGPIEITADEAKERGLLPARIRVDANAAGMSARRFPAKDVFLKLNGPPGGPLILMIWDCSNAPGDIQTIVRSKLVPSWAEELEIGPLDKAWFLGAEQTGVTFATGSGQARIAWFGSLVERPGGRLLVGMGVGGRDEVPVSAAEVVSNSAIKRALDTLTIT